ncbi:MAG: hypothetical protein WDN25_03825 [Acetobacteraceae bacterium]
MSSPRQFHYAVYAALKIAFRQLVMKVGGIDAAAACTRVSRSRISDYMNLASPLFPPLDVCLDLALVAGDLGPLIPALQALSHHAVRNEPGPGADIALAMAELAVAGGRIAATTLTAVSDGVITKAEILEIQRDAGVARRALDRVDAAAARPSADHTDDGEDGS